MDSFTKFLPTSTNFTKDTKGSTLSTHQSYPSCGFLRLLFVQIDVWTPQGNPNTSILFKSGKKSCHLCGNWSLFWVAGTVVSFCEIGVDLFPVFLDTLNFGGWNFSSFLQETSSSERPSVNAILTSSSSCFGNTPATVMDGCRCMKTDVRVATLPSCTNDCNDNENIDSNDNDDSNTVIQIVIIRMMID